jgi:hypothetical protein
LTPFLTPLSLFLGALTVSYCTYEEVDKLLTKKPGKPAIKPSVKHQIKPVIRLARTTHLEVLKHTITVEMKGSKEVKVLTFENFKELLSPYFIATEYLLELWIQQPFNLIITDKIQTHYGKDKGLNGFIRFRQIPEIYINASSTSKHKTAVLIHEIAHQRADKEGKLKKVKIQDHGKEFKRHMRILFNPLLEDRTYYKKNEELSYHLKYDSNKHTPTRDMCV